MGNFVSYSNINKRGGIGNQFFYYAFAKSYALKYGCELKTPKDWIFRKIFKLPSMDPIIEETDGYPLMEENYVPNGTANIDLNGCFQEKRHTSFYKKDDCLKYFEFFDKYKILFPYNPKDRYIAVHVRRGDYLINFWWACTISYESYLDILKKVNPENLEIRWVYESIIPDWPEKRFKSDLENPDDKIMSWLPDFFTLINSEILIRANSTFSYWAGMFHKGKSIYSPRVNGITGDNQFVKFENNNRCRVQSTCFEWDDFI